MAGAMLLALHAAACAGSSFQVVPTEIPRLAAGKPAATLDGEVRATPQYFDAKLELDEDAGRLMSRDGDEQHAIWIADPLVEQAARDGWETTDFATTNILEAEWGAPRARLEAARVGPRTPAPVGPSTTLWLRNHEGREAEVPVGAVESLAVIPQPAPGSRTWVAPLAVAGGLVLVAAVVGFYAAFEDFGTMR